MVLHLGLHRRHWPSGPICDFGALAVALGWGAALAAEPRDPARGLTLGAT